MADRSTESTDRFAEQWTLSIDQDAQAETDNFLVPTHVKESFAAHGYAVFPSVLSRSLVDELNYHLEDVLRGRYDRGTKPDKTPKLLKNEYRPTRPEEEDDGSSKNDRKKISFAAGPLGFSGNRQNVRVLQVINVHKCDSAFRKLAESSILGRVVAELAGWEPVGTRLAQDQVWAKPPGAPPLTFHRDSPYFMFDDPRVVTVWVALDDMDDPRLGPLQYVQGSHKWGDERVGSANQFFDADGGTDLLKSAALRAGESDELVVESMLGLAAGGISIHDGRTWHGSGPNSCENRPRRGLGLHFVPAKVKFTAEAAKSRLWRSYLEGQSVEPSEIDLPEDDFPITWMPNTLTE